MQYTDDVLENCTPETHIILLINFTSIKSIKKFLKKTYWDFDFYCTKITLIWGRLGIFVIMKMLNHELGIFLHFLKKILFIFR